MKSSIFKSCYLVGVLLLASAGTLLAQDEPVFSATASVDYFSKYVWRGQNLNDESVMQFNAAGSAYGFTGAIWSNMPLTDAVGSKGGEFDEIDYSLDYSRTISSSNDKVGFSLGVIHYTFPGLSEGNSVLATTEIYGGLNFNVPLNPSITWYRDIDAVDGSYIQFGVGHTFEKLGKWSDEEYVSLDLSASFGIGGPGYNLGYFASDTIDMEKTKGNDFTINVAVPFNLKHGITITPSFHVSTILSGAIRDTYSYGTGSSTNVWAGIGLSKSF